MDVAKVMLRAGRNANPDRVEEIADIRLLGFGGWLEDEFAVAHRLGDKREAVGRCLGEKLLHFSGRGAYLLIWAVSLACGSCSITGSEFAFHSLTLCPYSASNASTLPNIWM